jgi:hypothetical protein
MVLYLLQQEWKESKHCVVHNMHTSFIGSNNAPTAADDGSFRGLRDGHVCCVVQQVMLPPGARGTISYIAPAGEYTVQDEVIEIEFQVR